tara:strand:+ start:181 stop:504 length:324 start_codon:yes stop_codon:yes gene_type:complete
MAKMSPTQLSLKHLREKGWTTIAIVEHWNCFARIRQDLFGFIDILALNDYGHVLAVQTTSYSNMSARCKKIADNINIGNVRKAEWKVEVHGWKKVGNKWEVKINDLS